MADEPQYSSDSAPNKRKYDEQTTPPPPSSGARSRPTGFSAPVMSTPDSAAAPPSYNNVPPPVDDFQAAKRRAEEIAARLLNSVPADVKRPRVDNGSGAFDSADKGFSSPTSDLKSNPALSAIPVSYGSFPGMGTSKKIEIPNTRVGVIIGKSGETIKYLQLQSGAKIQVTRDTEADFNSSTRPVELVGTPEQIAKAEQLISDVLAEAEAGGSGTARRITGQSGSDHFAMKIPNNKVGLVIGKGGETIKNMQASTGARIQVIPLHLPPGDTSIERTVHIDGTSEQIENAKQLVNEVISENRLRNPAMAGGYPQQGYQSRRPPTSWGTPGAPPMQQPGYGYVQPGAYPGQTPQYNMSQPPYTGYPSQPTSGGYPGNWDQTSTQQTSQGSGYDYYSQQPSSQQPQAPGGGGGGSAAPADNTGYSYSQPPASGYSQQGQGYTQDGYGGYHAPQSGYGQAMPYDQQQGYNAASGYGNVTNSTQEGHTPTYGAQGDPVQAPPPVQSSAAMGQQGYGTSQQPSPNPASYPPQGASQPNYGVPPTSQSGYGSQVPAQSGYAGYGQKPLTNPSAYGQTQQSPGTAGGYGQPGYSHSQPPPSGYAQPDSGSQRAPPSNYGAANQPGYGSAAYGAPAGGSQAGYGQGTPSYNYGGGYSQPVYSVDGNTTPASHPVQPSGVTKSPQS